MATVRSSITPTIIERAGRIRLAAFDIDGVMSDGTLAYADNGSEIKRFHVLDGQGLKSLAHAGVSLAVISARQSAIVQRRAAELGIDHLIQGAGDKLGSLTQLAGELGFVLAQCAFMGDDVADLQALCACGLACSVPNAALAVQQSAHYVTRRAGGAGAVREFCELLVRARRARQAA